jgi:hypothetical protein
MEKFILPLADMLLPSAVFAAPVPQEIVPQRPSEQWSVPREEIEHAIEHPDDVHMEEEENPLLER